MTARAARNRAAGVSIVLGETAESVASLTVMASRPLKEAPVGVGPTMADLQSGNNVKKQQMAADY